MPIRKRTAEVFPRDCRFDAARSRISKSCITLDRAERYHGCAEIALDYKPYEEVMATVLGIGLVFAAGGAILIWGVDDTAAGVDLSVAGWIYLLAGFASVGLALAGRCVNAGPRLGAGLADILPAISSTRRVSRSSSPGWAP
jgi:hypothetical protein